MSVLDDLSAKFEKNEPADFTDINEFKSMEEALRYFQLSFGFVAKELSEDFKNPRLSMAEKRHRYDMLMKILGGYAPSKSEKREKVTIKWKGEK